MLSLRPAILKPKALVPWRRQLSASGAHPWRRRNATYIIEHAPSPQSNTNTNEKNSHLRLTESALFSMSAPLKSFLCSLQIIAYLAEIGSNGQRRLERSQSFLKVASAQVNSADVRMYGRVAGLKR
jgi:hypothetical protein